MVKGQHPLASYVTRMVAAKYQGNAVVSVDQIKILPIPCYLLDAFCMDAWFPLLDDLGAQQYEHPKRASSPRRHANAPGDGLRAFSPS